MNKESKVPIKFRDNTRERFKGAQKFAVLDTKTGKRKDLYICAVTRVEDGKIASIKYLFENKLSYEIDRLVELLKSSYLMSFRGKPVYPTVTGQEIIQSEIDNKRLES